MARLPYAEPDTDARKDVAARVVAERGSLLHLYSMLLHSAPVAEGWLTYLTAIRQKAKLPGDLREMVIMRVAHLNGASYEADQHRPIALKEGMSEPQLDSLQHWETASCFSPMQRAVLAYTDTMTRDVQVPDNVFENVANLFSPEMMVELTATVAAYNMVSRFLEALQIHSHDKD
ncbi:MAG: Carboxymuconolactone decarboxylase [Hyphomicrobiales bacterium]|nr:Carboxymuconolactone decarboxylase [Hyphomicrobiales bacterium]